MITSIFLAPDVFPELLITSITFYFILELFLWKIGGISFMNVLEWGKHSATMIFMYTP